MIRNRRCAICNSATEYQPLTMDWQEYDLVVIGSGFGGVMAAYDAVETGKRVLLIERGDWVRRSQANWGPRGFCELTDAYSRDAPYRVAGNGTTRDLGMLACVGGASVFFGGVSLRLRERDFEPDADFEADSGAVWPYRYADLEPFYTRAEQLLGVAGRAGEDPTEPPRSRPYAQPPAPLAPISERLATAARGLGLTPSHLPLAINYSTAGRTKCVACNTCDGFACAIGAKNDLALLTIPALMSAGLDVVTNTVVTRLDVEGRRVREVVAADRLTGAPRTYRGRAVVLAAGALASPQIVLASGLDRLNPAADAIGRYLMRHCNAVVMGAFLQRPAPHREFHKQLVIHDYYFGRPDVATPHGKLGSIQQWGTPQIDYVVQYLTGWKRLVASSGIPHTTGFIVIAEDRPRATNRVTVPPGAPSWLGLPRAEVHHTYDPRDLSARAALAGVAKRVLRRAGSLATFVQDIVTFSHAVGTLRLGDDPARAPLDPWGAFRGLDNLWVTDGSVFPRSGGVNPSLTIAANALRSGQRIAQSL
jgi:choline dehydrogenase-like flavoprotein